MPRRTVRRGPRRKLVWARLQTASTFTIPAFVGPQNFGVPFVADALGNFKLSLGASPVGCTIVRVRGIIAHPTKDILGTAALRHTLHVGDIRDTTNPVVADNAFADAAAYDDYMMYEPFLDYQSTAGPAGNVFAGSDVGARMIDVKANRKLQELDQTLIYKVSGNSVSLAAQQFVTDLSILIMLP